MNGESPEPCNESSVPEPCVSYDTPSCGQEASAVTPLGKCRPLSLSERLDERKARLQGELAEVNQAITAMQANKDVYNALNAITRVFGDRIH